jgi:ketosteroid isomerase-like protein
MSQANVEIVKRAIDRVRAFLDHNEAARAAESRGRAMSEEPTSPDVVELVRGFFEALNDLDVDAMMSFHAPDAVWDASNTGAGTFEGAAAVRGFLEDWYGAFEEWEGEPEQLLDLGNGVVFAVVRWDGRPVGSTGSVRARGALVFELADSVIVRVTVYTRIGIDEARAAAERLAESRE